MSCKNFEINNLRKYSIWYQYPVIEQLETTIKEEKYIRNLQRDLIATRIQSKVFQRKNTSLIYEILLLSYSKVVCIQPIQIPLNIMFTGKKVSINFPFCLISVDFLVFSELLHKIPKLGHDQVNDFLSTGDSCKAY